MIKINVSPQLVPSEGFRKNFYVSCLSQFSGGSRQSLSIPWLVAASLHLHIAFFLCLFVSSSFFTRTLVIGFRDHPKSRMTLSQDL